MGKEEERNNEGKKSVKRKFVFGSFLTQTNGNPFTFVEEAMHQCIKYLPQALEDLKNGLEPEDIEIYTLGSPTNTLGEMTPEFSSELEKEPIRKLANVYSELVQEKTPPSKQGSKTSVELFGLSMGGGLAAIAGENILETGAFTQDSDKAEAENLPRVQIRIDAPVSLSRSKIKPFQISAGFIIDGAVLLATNSYGRKAALGEGKFIKQVNAVLAGRGIGENVSKEQKDIKAKALRSIISALGKGLSLKPETKITEVYGTRDLTVYTPSFNEEVSEQAKEYPNTLGQNLVDSQRENSRTFAAKMTHVPPFFR